MTSSDLLWVPGTAESALPPDVLPLLPATTPGPPWDCRLRAVVWLQRGRAPLPAGSAHAGDALPVTVCAFVEYLDSPVGRYREVFAAPLLRRTGWPALHVPFMAVDSLPSLHAGRAHWQLPKSLAVFSGQDDALSARGEGWRVAAQVRPLGPRLPVALRLVTHQGGRAARMRLSGRVRAARVRVDADGPSLGGWLGHGTHAGLVGDARMVLGPAADV